MDEAPPSKRAATGSSKTDGDDADTVDEQSVDAFLRDVWSSGGGDNEGANS